MTPRPARLEAQHLRVVHGDRPVIRDLSLAVHPGEIVGVLGPTGAGKTTLFRVLVGELTPLAGRVLLEGRDVTRAPLWRRARIGLGYVPQTPSVLFDLTVRDNLETFEALAHRARKAPVGAETWAKQVELAARLDVRAGHLSGGERRRLELARALIGRPNILICDEPFAGMDPGGAGRVADLLVDQAISGAAVVLSDHHVAEALRICHRALLLLEGAWVVEGPPEAFVSNPIVAQRYLSPSPSGSSGASAARGKGPFGRGT